MRAIANLTGFLFGLTLAALGFLAMLPAHAADQYDTNVEINRLKPADAAILITLQSDKTMAASRIKVGHITDGTPLLCFKDPDKQLVGCFLLNEKTGQVVFVNLPADEASI